MVLTIRGIGLSAVVLALFTSSLTSLSPVQAHSTALATITRSEHILHIRHDVLPKGYNDPLPLHKRSDSESRPRGAAGIKKDDTIRVQLTAYNTTFHLYLEPNLDLIHPDADLGDDDFDRDEIKAYKGIVVQDEGYSDRRWDRAARTSAVEKRTIEHMLHEEGVLGWARMMVERDPADETALVLRGAFMVNDDTYHVTTREHYHIQKRADDALPPIYKSLPGADDLIIYRDSDMYKRSGSHAQQKRGLVESSCGTDQMRLNQQPAGISPPTLDDFYYPPNLTRTIPATGYQASSSWMDLLSGNSVAKRGLEIRAAGPNPVPEGCPVNRLVNYMGVAADCTYVRKYQGAAKVRQQILANFNTASAIYESTFNVALGVIALNIVPDGCPATPVKGQEWNQDCSPAYLMENRLSDFSFWRGQDGRANDGAGLWHLMTECASGPVVGIAWTDALCHFKTKSQPSKGKEQFTAGTGISSVSPNEWLIIAHEIGHGFGANHDCNQQSCSPSSSECCPLSATVCDAGARYIMNPSESTPTKLFSPCTIKRICTTIKNASLQCLKPPGTRKTQASEQNICGNGIREAGEECDCGSPEDCAKDPCCDGATCKYKNGAVCDDLNDDCCQNCKLRSAGVVCRQAISECDIQEVCSGTNATCPEDVRVKNQTPCKGTGNTTATGLACANGVCTSRDLQCQQQSLPGITKQCGATSTCDLTCNDPKGAPMSCTQVPGVSFIDGSPCGIGGMCNAGSCEYTGGIDGILNWAKGHLSIVIPVGVVVGLLLLCCIWSCCCGCLNRGRVQNEQKPQRLNSDGYQYAGFAPPPGGPPPQQYPMTPMPPPPPAYQNGQTEAYTQYNNSYNASNPFGDHNSAQFQHQQQQPPRPQQSGYI
ncbi:unnamed protein product [Mortierella alpina]